MSAFQNACVHTVTMCPIVRWTLLFYVYIQIDFEMNKSTFLNTLNSYTFIKTSPFTDTVQKVGHLAALLMKHTCMYHIYLS